MKKALIIVSICLAVAIGMIIYLVTGNDSGPNEEVVRAQERIKRLEVDLRGQRAQTIKAAKKMEGLQKDLAEAKAQKPIIEHIYHEERNRIRGLSADESVKYLAVWLSEVENN